VSKVLKAQALLPAVDSLHTAGAVYISTEDAFPHKRLQQLTEAFARKHKELGLSAQHLSDNIYVEHAATIVRASYYFLFFHTPLLYPPPFLSCLAR